MGKFFSFLRFLYREEGGVMRFKVRSGRDFFLYYFQSFYTVRFNGWSLLFWLGRGSICFDFIAFGLKWAWRWNFTLICLDVCFPFDFVAAVLVGY